MQTWQLERLQAVFWSNMILSCHEFMLCCVFVSVCGMGGIKWLFFFLQYPSAVGLCVRIAGW